jgi:hypothetical protein
VIVVTVDVLTLARPRSSTTVASYARLCRPPGLRESTRPLHGAR